MARDLCSAMMSYYDPGVVGLDASDSREDRVALGATVEGYFAERGHRWNQQ